MLLLINNLLAHYKFYTLHFVEAIFTDYFDNFLPDYGVCRHNLRNDVIRLPAIRCDFGEMNSKYQMHYRLRELASPSNPRHFPPLLINEDTLNKYPHDSDRKYPRSHRVIKFDPNGLLNLIVID